MSLVQPIDEKIILEILKTLVSKPEDIKIVRKVEEQGVLLCVKVNAFDMRIVIGKNGSMATALKTVIKAIGKANNTNVKIIFEEPDDRQVFKAEKKYEFDASQTSHYSFASDTVQTEKSKADAEVARSGLDHDLDDLVIN
jgi:uncharacterized protein